MVDYIGVLLCLGSGDSSHTRQPKENMTLSEQADSLGLPQDQHAYDTAREIAEILGVPVESGTRNGIGIITLSNAQARRLLAIVRKAQ